MGDLPNTFDIIVVGTGMPECILAAAAARIGKSVLHLDRNSHYGGNWASFNIEQLISYLNEQKALLPSPPDRMLEAIWLEQLNDNERLVLCKKTGATLLDIIQKSFIKDKKPSQAAEVSAAALNSGEGSASSQNAADEDEEHIVEENISPSILSDAPLLQESSSENVVDETTSGNVTESIASVEAASGDGTSSVQIPESSNIPDAKQEWTIEDLIVNRRKFNLDLSPKLLFARGSLVELLISSNVARYTEFQSVSRILTFIGDHLEQVPCSRADVFSTKSVSVVEKRMLMKLLTFCIEYQKHPEEYRGFEGKPFLDFLKSRKVTSNIEHYVMHAIAMVDKACPTLQGLSATQKFMESLGRYGNSPFLWSMYGSAELPQCFCRLCAIFGGIYHLKRDIDAVILNSENECVGLISSGNKFSCQSLVLEYSYAPKQFVPECTAFVSRAIYITNSSILPSERQQNTLLRLPPVEGIQSAITVLEFGSLSFICPDNLFIVHMTCESLHESVEEDFKAAEINLFKNAQSDEIHEDSRKPSILWCTYFHQTDNTTVNMNSKVPKRLFLTSNPGPDLDYEHAVAQAKEIFLKLYPEEEFLPRAPDPDEIVLDECSNPGEKPVEESELFSDESNLQDLSEEQLEISEDTNKPGSSNADELSSKVEQTSQEEAN